MTHKNSLADGKTNPKKLTQSAHEYDDNVRKQEKNINFSAFSLLRVFSVACCFFYAPKSTSGEKCAVFFLFPSVATFSVGNVIKYATRTLFSATSFVLVI